MRKRYSVNGQVNWIVRGYKLPKKKFEGGGWGFTWHLVDEVM